MPPPEGERGRSVAAAACRYRMAASRAWKLLIVDDDHQVHQVTRLLLSDYTHEGRALDFISAYSGGEARALLRMHWDISVVLLDLVMEDQDEGLRLVRFIREELNNRCVRIMLRTGHPGRAPAREAILNYDIDDYREKSELSAQKLLTSVVSALRSYHTLTELGLLTAHLERVVEERTAALKAANSELARMAAELKQRNDRLSYEKDLSKAVFARIAAPERASGLALKQLLWPLDGPAGDLVLTAVSRRGRRYLMLGDFTGHGLPAALCALPIAELFKRMGRKGKRLDEMVGRINRRLKESLPQGLFLAALFVEFEPHSRHLWVFNAGSPAALLFDRRGRIRKRIAPMAPPLGILGHRELRVDTRAHRFHAGDRLFACSDGLLEAQNLAGEVFGPERLEAAVRAGAPAARAFESVREALERFTAGAPRGDDIAAIELPLEG